MPAGSTQTAFAGKLGWTRARLNELIKGKRGITAETALDLAKTLGTSAKLWMNLQATYDLDQALKRRETVIIQAPAPGIPEAALVAHKETIARHLLCLNRGS